MPVTPISPSVASTGGLPSFVGSGTTSSVFSHDQTGYITYQIVTESTLNSEWPMGCNTKKKFKLDYTAQVDEEVFDWNFSGDASSASGLANTYSCMSGTVNSYDSSVGLGTSGYIHFVTGSYTRLAASTDLPYHHISQFDHILMTCPVGQNNELVDDAATMNLWVATLNTYIRTGGLKYSPTDTPNNVLSTDPEYGWETRLFCP
tara:strand:+ start:423 stop:1034 length:612 start_codon:yes stop_codon:yes gene_type:complete